RLANGSRPANNLTKYLRRPFSTTRGLTPVGVSFQAMSSLSESLSCHRYLPPQWPTFFPAPKSRSRLIRTLNESALPIYSTSAPLTHLSLRTEMSSVGSLSLNLPAGLLARKAGTSPVAHRTT